MLRRCLTGAMVIASLNLARVRDEVRRIIHTESSGGIRPTAKIQSVSNTLYLPLKYKTLSEFIFVSFFASVTVIKFYVNIHILMKFP